MKANRGTNTTPERQFRARLHALGWRYRVNLRLVVGGVATRPDVAFTRRRIAVFIDGCFWHGCPEHASWPKSNPEFWRNKIEGNRRRDQQQSEALLQAGWTVMRVWEHEDIDAAVARITALLESPLIAP
jgi:DNA mismatch endonuclease (patch repair protein)